MEHPHPAQDTRPGPWRIGASWIFGALVLAAVVLVASQFTQIERFAQIARDAEPVWLLLAFVLQVLTYACAAGVWYGTLRRAGLHQSFASIIPLGLAKLFTDQALPSGGIGGTLLVVSGLERRGVPSGIGMAALLTGLLSYYVAYLVAVLSALVILYVDGALDGAMIIGAGLFILVALGVPAIVLGIRRWSRRERAIGPLTTALEWLERIPGFTALMTAMSEAPSSLLRDPVSFGTAFVLQLGVFALDAATLWVMLQALGADGSPTIAIAAFVMASLAATVGPMPLGLGTFEAVCVAVLHIQGPSVEVALTATLLLRGFTFWLPMIPGLILARRELTPAARSTPRGAKP